MPKTSLEEIVGGVEVEVLAKGQVVVRGIVDQVHGDCVLGTTTARQMREFADALNDMADISDTLRGR